MPPKVVVLVAVVMDLRMLLHASLMKVKSRIRFIIPALYVRLNCPACTCCTLGLTAKISEREHVLVWNSFVLMYIRADSHSVESPCGA